MAKLKNTHTEVPVKGGIVKRETHTGQFVSVSSDGKTRAASEVTQQAVKEASEKRSSALKRLADR